jgi:hypothetical protein
MNVKVFTGQSRLGNLTALEVAALLAASGNGAPDGGRAGAGESQAADGGPGDHREGGWRGHVYFATDGVNVKIAFSINPANRMRGPICTVATYLARSCASV